MSLELTKRDTEGKAAGGGGWIPKATLGIERAAVRKVWGIGGRAAGDADRRC